MCDSPRFHQVQAAGVSPRRQFLKLAGLSAIAALVKGEAAADELKAPPKPQNVMSPDAALERLIAGNKRYIDGSMRRHDFNAERPALAKGQNPFAGILSCADSRVGPEYAFDTGRGDLFVVRVAGNFVTEDGLASFEYAVKFLGTPLLVVLGHRKCGAVDAAIQYVSHDAKLPGHIPKLAKAIAPAVKASAGEPGDALDNAIRANVQRNVRELREASPIVSAAVRGGMVKVVGGIYDLDTGRVDFFA